MLRAFAGWYADSSRSSGTGPRNTFQPACPPYPQHRSHRAAAAFPLGCAAGGEISLPQRPAALMRRRSNPRWPRRPDQEDRSLRGRRLKSPFPHPHRSPLIGARPLSPIPARLPRYRVSAPCSPPDQRMHGYPNPTYLNQSRGQLSKWKPIQSNSPTKASQTRADRSEDRVLDAIQGGDHPGSAKHDGQPDPESAGNGLHPMVIGRGPLLSGDQGGQVVTEKRASGTWKAHARPLAEDLPVAPDRDAAMPFRAGVPYIPRDFCCPVIAALLFPDMEQGPAIVAAARRSYVQIH